MPSASRPKVVEVSVLTMYNAAATAELHVTTAASSLNLPTKTR